MTDDADGTPAPAGLVVSSTSTLAGDLGVSSVEKSDTASMSVDPQGSDPQKQIDFADTQLEYLNVYVQLADTKAGVTFTVASGVLGFLISTVGFAEIARGNAPPQYVGLQFATLAILAASASLSLWVVFPRKRSAGDGIFSWVDVAAFRSPIEYATKIATLPLQAIADARLAHCYQLARICAAKYSKLRWAMGTGMVGVFLAFFYWLAVPEFPITN